MVARATKGNYEQTVMYIQFFSDYETPIMGITPQNVPQTSNTLLSPTKSMVARFN